MKKVVVYTMQWCPYCVGAKNLLKVRGIPFQEIMLPDDDDAQWNALYEKSRMRTVPQIFVDERLIGGFNELKEQDSIDHLASLKEE